MADLASDFGSRQTRAREVLEGLSVGDAFGERFFCAQNRPRVAKRELPPAPWHWTDDTAMATGILEVLTRGGQVDPDELAEHFARRYAEDPHRGYGAMARHILQAIGRGSEWRSVSKAAFGRQGSMGNGGAMRVAPLGAWFADDPEAVPEQACASARVTHAHPEGQAGAIAVAVAVAWAWRERLAEGSLDRPQHLLKAAWERTPAGLTRDGINRARELSLDLPVPEAVGELGNGSTVTAPETVPFCLWCAARHLDRFEEALWSVVEASGDIDTNGAIVGGIVVAASGAERIPPTWLQAREALPL